MDKTFEKYKKKVYVEKTYINEKLADHNKTINALTIAASLFFGVTVAIVLIEAKWHFGIIFYTIPTAACGISIILALLNRYLMYKKALNEYKEKVKSLKEEFEKTITEEENVDKTYLEIRASEEYRQIVKEFFINAEDTEKFVYLSNKTIIASFFVILLCFVVQFAVSNSYNFSPKRWRNNPEKRSYMAQDIKNRLNMNLLHDKYNLYSLTEDEIARLFYIEDQEVPEIDFKFYSDYETYYAHYMYTENGVNYWVIGIHQDNFWKIDFVETGDVYTGTLGENIDEPPVPLEDRTPLLPENHK